MFFSMPDAPVDADDLVFDDDDTFASPPDTHPLTKAAEDARSAARRTREWRARQKDRALLDAVLVDAMVSAQLHVRDAARRSSIPIDAPPPVTMSAVIKLADRELRRLGWPKAKRQAHLSARLMPLRTPMDPL